ncbi:hypothetical protein GSI_10216 [Ganoderma sinense ZZ0214-1]|uniref:MYND-type domain-containing protein n=1 Tax=Ganoderma sinense ZZ0214-1 TaxID=1077348 RepID=A0A2G8S005_9APHY|nr:hypothetical protein GSI_10216 [Ganoderma sinense ZZ0214-1]
MASSLSFSPVYQFYPIGNTTAVSLTRDLPPDVHANILLLPCGDPRNVLYTVFCERSNLLRKGLDFTCCDYDPGVLARDVLLLTMIVDRVAEQIMWNIFFHMYLDLDSRSILVSQSQKLASYASLEAWRSSPYGSAIKMGSDHTFAELRRLWGLYADFYQPSNLPRLRSLQQTMDKRLKHEAANPGDNLPTLRSAGLLSFHPQASRLFRELDQRYWETGTTFTDKIKLAASTYPNSTFLYSRAGEGFNLSPITDPMIPFHHAPLFGNAGDLTLTVDDLVESAQSQFRTWCAAFQTATTEKTCGQTTPVVVRFLLGDALAVARALQDFPDNPTSGRPSHPWATSTVAQWTAFPMELNLEEYADHGAPTRFDAIDTSNISDYLSLFNLFLATAPLLTGAPSSVLYTESLGLFSSSPSTEFQATLFASLSVVAVLMDLAPVDVLSGFTSKCNTHELIITYVSSKHKNALHQKFTWKRPRSGDSLAYCDGGSRLRVSFRTHQLASVLYNVYLDMFRIEDPKLAETLQRALSSPRSNDILERTLVSGWMVGPSREAFVVFLCFVHACLRISEEQWSDIVRSFLEMRKDTHSDFDTLRDSEIRAQLYRYGLYTAPGLDHPNSPSTTAAEPGRLSHWLSIPPLMRIFFTVPHAEFAKLERALVAAKVPTSVWLHCVIEAGLTPERESHFFHSLNVAYGTLVDTGTAAKPVLSFREDRDGHKNGADLVLSFVVPSYILTKPPAGTAIIKLVVRSEPITAPFLIPALGRTMCVFSVNLEDTDRVHLLPEEPLHPRPLLSRPSSPARMGTGGGGVVSLGPIGHQLPVHVEVDSAGKKIESLTARLEITDASAKAAFAEGIMPIVSQCSPCTVQVVLGGRTHTLAYPVPIVGSRRKLRLARKSSYIEVVVPVAIPFLEPDGLKVNRFPVVHANGSLVPWNVHRVFLDQLPTLERTNIGTSQLAEWYHPHLTWQLSHRERAVRTSADPAHAHSDALVNVKQSIAEIMMHAAGLGMKGIPPRVFALQHSALRDTETLLFVDKLRFDVVGHTIVCDAFVLSVSLEILPHISQAMPSLVKQGVAPIPMHDAHSEMRAWKALLPALAERCRATWAHGANCEYRAVQPDGSVRWRIPRELTAGSGDRGDPLCSCGLGKDVEGTGMVRDRVWRKFAPYVTRIALSPLWGVSHVEQILESEDMYPSEKQEPVEAGAASALNPAVYAVGSNAIHGGSNDALDSSKVVPPGLAMGPKTRSCDRCKKEEAGDVKLLLCSRCRVVLYCSSACQKSDWKTHKPRCKTAVN